MMPHWYTIHSFETSPDETDLSAFFLTPGIAEPHLQNTKWRLIETNYSPSSGTLYYSGNISADGTLDAGNWPTNSEPTFIFDFWHLYPYTGYMELQGQNESGGCMSASPCGCGAAGGGASGGGAGGGFGGGGFGGGTTGAPPPTGGIL